MNIVTDSFSLVFNCFIDLLLEVLISDSLYLLNFFNLILLLHKLDTLFKRLSISHFPLLSSEEVPVN